MGWKWLATAHRSPVVLAKGGMGGEQVSLVHIWALRTDEVRPGIWISFVSVRGVSGASHLDTLSPIARMLFVCVRDGYVALPARQINRGHLA